MRRSALPRRTPLRSSSRLARVKHLAAKRDRPRRSSRVLDPAYLAWVRTQLCVCGDAFVCEGRTEPDHQREGVGAGRKASDRDSYPLCSLHHRHRHDLTGPFRGWTRERLRTWIAERIAEANARYDAARAANGGM